jgi:isopentenyldiphosphate isomerase
MSSDHSTFVQQNDPAELLEIFDASGQPTGRAKSRAAVHLDGDWHQAFHCWILRHGGAEIVLQRRSFEKDTFAGFWDAAAAGHWRYRESADQAAREVEEELGLHVDFSRLRYSGRERLARRFANGLIDREHHQVYLLHDDRPLLEYRPDPAEVIGLAAFRSLELLDLVGHRIAALAASEAVTVHNDGALETQHIVIARSDLVPYSSARLQRLLKLASHG